MNDVSEINQKLETSGVVFVDSMITDQEVFYDTRAEVYDEQNEIPSRVKRRENMYAIYHSLLPSLLPKQIAYLDFGCGTGSATNEFMAGLIEYTRVVKGYAVDISPEMVKLASKNLPNFTFVQGGTEKLNFNNKFDLITAFFYVLCHLSNKDLEVFFQNASKSLKPQGLVCFEVIKQFEVGERGYTQDDKSKNRKYFAYHSLKKDGSKIIDTNKQPMIGTDRMFEANEISNLAESNGLNVVEIKEVVIPNPNTNIESLKELLVVLQKG